MPPASPAAPQGSARALKALRRFSTLVTEADTPEALARDLCRVLVEDCGYRMAWVGLTQHDQARSVRPLASYGFEDGYLALLEVSWSADSERGRGPSGTSIREGRPCAAQDLRSDPRAEPWRAEMLRRGYLSSVAVPLGPGAPARGTLGVYAPEAGAFGPEDIELFEELANSLDRAINALKARKERLALADALKSSEAKFRSLVERSLAGVYVIQDKRFRYANPRLAEILGYTVPELLGLRDIMETVMPEDRAQVAENIRRRLAGETADLHYRIRGRRKDGAEVLMEVLGASIDYEGRPAVMGTLLDVTRQQALQERLARAKRLEAVGRLAGGVAHDFNNLLTTIMGACDLALERTGPVDPRRLELEDIRRSADRAAALSRELLSFSRKQVVAPKVLEAGAVVRGLDSMLRRLVREDTRLTVEAACRTRVLVDAGQLENAVVNLVVNARDAMGGGGRLLVKVAEERLEAPRSLHDRTLPPGVYAVVSVSDTGCGIAPEVLPRVFEPFFSTKGDAGTGLGLAIVGDIAEEAGGAVGIDSAVGAGTTVRLYLPATSEPAAPSAPAYRPAEAREGCETLLLVEDEPSVRSVLRRQLVARGYEVLEASGRAEALRVVETHHGRIDLLISDVVLPGGSGWELGLELRKRRPGMRLLFLSGYAQDARAGQRLLSQGAVLLAKPVSGAELARKVREALTPA